MNKLTLILVALLGITTIVSAQNNGLDFDGVNQYVDCGVMNLSNQSFAIEGWFKAETLPAAGGYAIIFGNVVETVNAANLRINGTSNKLEFAVGSQYGWAILTSSTVIQIGVWYHVAIVRYWNQSGLGNDNHHIFVNGSIDASISYDNFYNYSYSTFRIGGNGSGSCLDGIVDDVKVWSNINRGLESVREDMYKEVVGNETGLLAYYKLDETSGTTANDSQTSSNYDGTLTNMTGNEWTTSSAFFGPKNCLDFDGNDYVRAKNVPVSAVTNAKTTVEFWMYWNGTVDQIPFSFLNNYTLWFTPGNDFGINTYQGDCYGMEGNNLFDNKWAHVAVVFNNGDITNGSKIYVNGVNQSLSKLLLAGPLTLNVQGEFVLGAANAGTHWFNGKIDELRIWNGTRTEAQIRENMYKSLVGDESNLIAYYNLDNTSGTSVPCYPEFDNDGTNYGATWVASTAFNTWVDTDDSDWSTELNWSRGSVPTSTDNVGIANYTGGSAPEIDGTPALPSLCNNLSINSGATLEINEEKAITVSGDLFNDGTFTVNSSNTGTGSLIVEGTATGNVTAQRYIHTGSSDNQGWHLLSSPVVSQLISAEFVDIIPEPIVSPVDLYKWNEPLGLWINIKNVDGDYNVGGANTNWSSSATPEFETSKGYLIAYDASTTKTFEGELITASPASISGLTYTSDADYHGSHLIGNPYTCALKWNFTTGGDGWNVSGLYETVKIWDEEDASYTDIAAGGIIPAMQGFMVNVTEGNTGALTICEGDRVHSDIGWHKNAEINKIKLIAHDIEGGKAQETVIMFKPDATEGIDVKYDSHFMSGYAPLFYTTAEGKALSSNALPYLSDEVKIPLSFIKNNSNIFSIEAIGIDNFEPNELVYLTDLKTNYTQLLNDNPIYEFVSEEGDNAQRFILHFGPLSINDVGFNANIINTYASNNTLYILNPNQKRGIVIIYNLTGQKVAAFELTGNTKQQRTLNVIDMINIVKIQTNDEVISEKVIFR